MFQRKDPPAAAGEATTKRGQIVTRSGKVLETEERSNRLGWVWMSLTLGGQLLATVSRAPSDPQPKHKRGSPVPAEQWHFRPLGIARHPGAMVCGSRDAAIDAACKLAEEAE